MTAVTQTSPASGVRGFIRNPVVLWSGFVLAHLVLGLLNLYGSGYPLGDVTSVYKFWTDQVIQAGYWVGIDGEWVYPIVAIVPMLAAQAIYPIADAIPGLAPATLDASLYASAWLSIVMILNLVAFGVLTGWGRRPDRVGAAWWWTGFILALGPISLGRIDSITVPIAVIGALLVATRPLLATVLLTVGAWIKVWPGAIVIAMVVATRSRWRVLVTAIGVSAGIVALALSYGSGLNVFSFVTQQTGRGLQVEAPVSTIWMWLAFAGEPGTRAYYDTDLLTWQVSGPGVAGASALMTPLMLLVVLAVVIIGLLAVLRRVTASAILPPLVLALLTSMIAFQKVGSPQFITWLAVPVILGLVSHREGNAGRFRTPAVLVLLLGVLTHILYPYLYGYLLGLFPAMLVVLTVRNLLLFVLLGWAVVVLARLRTADAPGPD